ncbi:MAG: hypothetical protein ACFFE5_03455 [Candidatus Thorarchaeota archaeon]
MMKRNNVLNLLFIAIFIVFLVLSLLIDFFFFLPIICFIPFSVKNFRNKDNDEKKSPQFSTFTDHKNFEIRYCQKCGGEITERKAQFCYHCGEKLNIR